MGWAGTVCCGCVDAHTNRLLSAAGSTASGLVERGAHAQGALLWVDSVRCGVVANGGSVNFAVCMHFTSCAFYQGMHGGPALSVVMFCPVAGQPLNSV